MANYSISKKAISDLDSIWEYTAQTWSVEQADAYYLQIYESIRLLPLIPDFLGRSFDTVKPGLRGFHSGHHIIFYKKRDDGSVLVDRILHEKMDFSRHI